MTSCPQDDVLIALVVDDPAQLAGVPDDVLAMMKAAAQAAASLGIPCELSLESIMGCGIGACWGCVHRIRNDAGDGLAG